MNYLKTYVSICQNAKKRKAIPDVYYEKHHVFPISIFGKNKFIVKLTYREHFIAHKLLYFGFRKKYGIRDQRTKKMAYAFHIMVHGKGDTSRNLIISSNQYKSSRTAVSDARTGSTRPDMFGKRYFGASEEKIKIAIEKIRSKKVGVSTNYPKTRKSSPCSEKKAMAISASRQKTKEKFIKMDTDEFQTWISNCKNVASDGRKNPNISRAIKWRKDAGII
jgi:hypothetical protein